MPGKLLAEVSREDLAFFWFFVFLAFLFVFTSFCVSIWLRNREGKKSLSPYSGKPLRRGSDLSMMTREKVLDFLDELHQYDNMMFDLHKSAYCRETGRIFPNCISWRGIEVDWTFLTKRFPANWISWGSLTPEQKKQIIVIHGGPIKGFQTKNSSRRAAPHQVEPQFAYAKPGPLYVDLDSHILMGWKRVPGTDMEVLIIKRPPMKVEIPKLPEEENE